MKKDALDQLFEENLPAFAAIAAGFVIMTYSTFLIYASIFKSI